jgi:hypothetical protein
MPTPFKFPKNELVDAALQACTAVLDSSNLETRVAARAALDALDLLDRDDAIGFIAVKLSKKGDDTPDDIEAAITAALSEPEPPKPKAKAKAAKKVKVPKLDPSTEESFRMARLIARGERCSCGAEWSDDLAVRACLKCGASWLRERTQEVAR